MASFLVFKTALMLAAIAFAVREIIVAGRPDSDPEFTRKLVHVFSAAGRARDRAAPASPPPAVPTGPAAEPAPANDPEAPRRAA